jgi:UDPglucose 6-dehydrogenase
MAFGRASMKICVLGLWHLGSVTAAGLAALGHQVVGVDFDETRIANLRKGIAPIFEPGLDVLINREISSGNLRFSSDLSDAIKDIDVLWVAYDTPVDDQDNADTGFVMSQAERAVLAVSAEVLVLVSSQLPVGSLRRLEQSFASKNGSRRLKIAYCPENLRLGTALQNFLHPERMVVGIRSSLDEEPLRKFLGSITESIVWMSIESAEMTKHAINAFFATSITFANEIASICEAVGADAKEVERGLKTEGRIGPLAYLSPGGAFSGGTLARDVAFLNRIALERGVNTQLLSSVLSSNQAHKQWAQRKLQALFADLSHTTVAVWGLTYKPDTDTIARSMSVELCDWMLGEGATVHVHDPMARNLPAHWHASVKRYDDPVAAVCGAHVLIMSTPWPLYRAISADQLLQCVDGLVVLDANRFLSNLAVAREGLTYFAVGVPNKEP